MSNHSRLRICLVSQQLGKVMSGPGVHTRILATHLHNDGHNVTVIVPESQLPKKELPFQLATVNTPPFQSTQARWIGLSYSFAKKIERLEKSTTYDLVHFTDAREAFFYRSNLPKIGNINDTYAANLMPLKYYKNYYFDWALRYFYYALVHKIESIALPKLDAVIANSQFTANTVKRAYSINSDKLWVCYKAIQPETYRAAFIKRHPFESQPQRILFIGGNMQRKGICDLILAAKEVIKEIPHATFRIIGQDKHIPKLQKICQENGVESNFEFIGWKPHEELVSEYSEAYMFVMPSLTEAFGLVFLEGMASGVPIIGTMTGGIPEIITHEKNGLLTPVNDPIALSSAILALFHSPERCDELQKAALDTVNNFSVERMMRCTYRIYEAVLSKFR